MHSQVTIARYVALEKAGAPADDRGEPSWGALAHLIRETRFMQVNRRLMFMKMVWSVPVDEFWADARPFVANHRYRTFLEGWALPPQEIRPAFVEFANKVDLNELEGHEPELFAATERYQTSRGEKHDGGFAFGHGDAIARDLAASVQTPDVPYRVAQAKVLLAVSPNSTLAQGILVTHAWEEFKDRARAWEEKGSDSPLLLDSLGARYAELKQFDRAKGLLRRCLALSPQHSVYKSLAGIYKEEGDMENWRKTLEEYLAKGEDKGLDHASTRVEIARYYMDQKKWKEAKPYAEAAAETWAGWAMECAVECDEAMGEWEQGEAMVRRLTERYPNTAWPRWYCFCKRTGHGDIESAHAWTDAYLDSARGRPDLADPTAVAYYYWLSGSTKQALSSFNALYVATPNPSVGLPLLLVADEVGDKARRDEVLKELCTKMKAQAPKSLAIGELMRAAIDADKPLDLAAVDSILETIPPEGRGNAEYFVGKFLMNRGQPDLGRKYLQKAAESPKTHDWSREIARSLVRPVAKVDVDKVEKP